MIQPIFIHMFSLPELLIDGLFKPGSKINQEHKSKYIFLLAYASSVIDTWNYKRNTRKNLNKEELKGKNLHAQLPTGFS